jgi:hypothetical protein
LEGTTKQEAAECTQNQSQTVSSSTTHANIYPVTEGIKSQHTATKYRINFKHFLDYIKIQDLQVLLDLGPKVIQEMIIKYVLYLLQHYV